MSATLPRHNIELLPTLEAVPKSGSRQLKKSPSAASLTSMRNCKQEACNGGESSRQLVRSTSAASSMSEASVATDEMFLSACTLLTAIEQGDIDCIEEASQDKTAAEKDTV